MTPSQPIDPAEATSSAAGSGSAGGGASGYSARDLTVLEGLEAVRKRPGMYIGSTDSRGLTHCLWEIVDNAVDEALAGHCTRVDVVLHTDGSIEVRDDGRGIPVDVEPRSGLTGVELVLTKLHAGGKFGGGSYGASGGLHGVGASVVNALSARLDVEVDRGGRTHLISFRRGLPGVFDGPGPDAPFTPAGGLRLGGKVAKGRTGTRVRYWADRQIFLKDAHVHAAALEERLRQTAFLVPGLTLCLRDERVGLDGLTEPREEEYVAAGGTEDFCRWLAEQDEAGLGAAVCDVQRLTGSGRFVETVPVLDGSGQATMTDVERDVFVDVAVRWGAGFGTQVRSFVNVVATPKGGTHVAGFERAMLDAFRDVLRAGRVQKAGEEPVTKDDLLEGLAAVVTVRLAEPQFEGQTKEILGTPGVTRIVDEVVDAGLREFLTSTRAAVRPMARAVLEKVAEASRVRVEARRHKETARRKKALESSALPAKLVDCRSEDVERTELFIVEGDSALGTAKLARDSEFQALLPIRGKILNAQKATVTDLLKNAECASIIQVVGAGSGRTFDLDAVRYGKIILMADADVDGSHIRTLLLTLIHKQLAPLLTAGRVFAAMPPLHRVEVTAGPRTKPEVIYTYSDAELHRLLADLERRGRKYKEPQRYKGLGEMDAHQLAETTMDPAKRLLRRINLGDATSAEKAFDLLMGKAVEPRKEFIVESAYALDRSRIDA